MSALITEVTEPSGRLDFEQLSLKEISNRFDFTPDPITGRSTDWDHYCHLEHHLYEYPTREYISGLAHYMGTRILNIEQALNRQVRIVEVAAGEGLLTQLLSQALKDSGVAHTMIATDDGSWRHHGHFNTEVALIDCHTALQTYTPDLVIGAWLPDDWTPAMRQCPTVQEYLLIGKTIPPNRHGNHRTWGQEYDYRTGKLVRAPAPEYMQEGFRRRNLSWLRRYQINYEAVAGSMNSSETVSFRRMPQSIT